MVSERFQHARATTRARALRPIFGQGFVHLRCVMSECARIICLAMDGGGARYWPAQHGTNSNFGWTAGQNHMTIAIRKEKS
eukprot:9456382-Pyramimonas_sp.AAC.1